MVVLLLLQVDGRIGGRIGQVPLAVDALALVPKPGEKLVLQVSGFLLRSLQIGGGALQGVNLPLNALLQRIGNGFGAAGQLTVHGLQVFLLRPRSLQRRLADFLQWRADSHLRLPRLVFGTNGHGFLPFLPFLPDSS